MKNNTNDLKLLFERSLSFINDFFKWKKFPNFKNYSFFTAWTSLRTNVFKYFEPVCFAWNLFFRGFMKIYLIPLNKMSIKKFCLKESKKFFFLYIFLISNWNGWIFWSNIHKHWANNNKNISFCQKFFKLLASYWTLSTLSTLSTSSILSTLSIFKKLSKSSTLSTKSTLQH